MIKFKTLFLTVTPSYSNGLLTSLKHLDIYIDYSNLNTNTVDNKFETFLSELPTLLISLHHQSAWVFGHSLFLPLSFEGLR